MATCSVGKSAAAVAGISKDFTVISDAASRGALDTDLAYEIIVRQQGKRFHLHIRELRLWASSDDLAKAHGDMEAKRRALIAAYVDAGAADDIPLPRQMRRRTRFSLWAKLFAFRAAVVTLCAAVLIAVTLSLLTAYLSPVRSILALTESTLRNAYAPGGLLKSLDHIATGLESIPLDQREKAASDMQRISKALAPFMLEFQSAPKTAHPSQQPAP